MEKSYAEQLLKVSTDNMKEERVFICRICSSKCTAPTGNTVKTIVRSGITNTDSDFFKKLVSHIKCKNCGYSWNPNNDTPDVAELLKIKKREDDLAYSKSILDKAMEIAQQGYGSVQIELSLRNERQDLDQNEGYHYNYLNIITILKENNLVVIDLERNYDSITYLVIWNESLPIASIEHLIN